jgi:hypothetical protein
MRIPKFTLRREQLESIKRKIITWTGLIIILAGITILYERYELSVTKQDIKELKKQYGDKIIGVYEELDEIQKKVISLTEDKNRWDSDKKKEMLELQKIEYFYKCTESILGGYAIHGMKRTKDERKVISDTVVRVFDCMEVCKEKGLLKNFAKTVRIAAIRTLGAFKRETNFDLNCVQWNYVRERRSRYVLLFMPEDKKLIESLGKLGDQNYKAFSDGNMEFTINNKKYKAKPIGRIEKIIISDKDEVIVSLNGIKTKVKAIDYAIKTTRDWGGLQVNDINLEHGYKVLAQKGIWNASMDKWTLDPEINIYLRMTEFEQRITDKLDEIDHGPWDQNLVESLEKVEGWEGIYE